MMSDSDYADISRHRQQRQIAPDSSTPPRPIRRSAGRPSKHDPAFCERGTEPATAEGLSWGACAGDIGFPGKGYGTVGRAFRIS
jgi:hypothetical protein